MLTNYIHTYLILLTKCDVFIFYMGLIDKIQNSPNKMNVALQLEKRINPFIDSPSLLVISEN